MPSNTAASAMPFSEALSKFAVHLTLDYIFEFCASFDKLSQGQKTISIQFVSPWLKNLNAFVNPLSPLFDANKSKLRECLRFLIDITVKDPEASYYHLQSLCGSDTSIQTYPLAQRSIWFEIGKLDGQIMDLAIDELVRVAVDGGITSLRCELVADTLVSLSSVSVRGKVIHRLRKAFSKTSHTQTRDLVENPAWPEIAALTRLALVVSYNTRQPVQSQLYAPETSHLIVALAAVGPIHTRIAVHGLLVNLIQSLHASRADNSESAEELRILLEDAVSAQTLHWFGLVRAEESGEHTMAPPFTDVEAVDALENITRCLKRVLAVAAPSPSKSYELHEALDPYQILAQYNAWCARWMSLVSSTAFQISPYIQGRAFAALGILATDHVDDDNLFQILVAFRKALEVSNQVETSYILSMLRCITNIVTALSPTSRYLPNLFWLPISLLQTPNVVLYKEALRLLEAILMAMDEHRTFDEETGIVDHLLDMREPFKGVTAGFEEDAGISFETSFTFSLTKLILRGTRTDQTRSTAVNTLYCLLRLISKSSPRADPQEPRRQVDPDAVAYFVALWPWAKPYAEEIAPVMRAAELSPEEWLDQTVNGSRASSTLGPQPLPLPVEILGIADDEPTLALLVMALLVSFDSLEPADRANTMRFVGDIGRLWPHYAMMACAYQ